VGFRTRQSSSLYDPQAANVEAAAAPPPRRAPAPPPAGSPGQFRGQARLPRFAAPRRYELRLRPDLVACTFTGTAAVTVDVSAPTRFLVLNAADLSVDRASIRFRVRTRGPSSLSRQSVSMYLCPSLGAKMSSRMGSSRIWHLRMWCFSRTMRSWCWGSPTSCHSAWACSV
jgi:hypothetical protein